MTTKLIEYWYNVIIKTGAGGRENEKSDSLSYI